MAAVDVAGAATAISETILAVSAVGVSVLSVAVLIVTFRRLRAMLFEEEDNSWLYDTFDENGNVNGSLLDERDPWDGYTAEDDARDREAAGL